MLIPIKYHNKNYPGHIKPQITEIAGHFDISSIPKVTSFSLHTEYSYGKRKFSSMHINNYNELRVSEKNGISQLWFSDKWSSEFANFIKDLCADEIPHIIEIHPPFNDYTDSMKIFRFFRVCSSFRKTACGSILF